MTTVLYVLCGIVGAGILAGMIFDFWYLDR